MNTDALSDLIRDVGDDSPPKDQVIFVLWSAIDDALHPLLDTEHALRRGLKLAAEILERETTENQRQSRG